MLTVAQTASDSSYSKEIQLWDQQRVLRLKSETGWLNLAGLIWLKEGTNTFGTEASNDLRFPVGKGAAKMGSIVLLKNQLTLIASDNSITVNGKPWQSGPAFSDHDTAQPTLFAYKSLRWFIIKRGNRYAIRLRDFESDAIKNFIAIPRFPIDVSWNIEATFELPAHPDSLLVTDVIGLTTATPIGGILHFIRDGKKYDLIATLEEDDKLFIVFADKTSGETTYGGGRFLYTNLPKKGASTVMLDFNKAYNPPCAFTHFATCPLPVAANRLDLAITAGEQFLESH